MHVWDPPELVAPHFGHCHGSEDLSLSAVGLGLDSPNLSLQWGQIIDSFCTRFPQSLQMSLIAF